MDVDEDPVTEEPATLVAKNATRVAAERGEMHEFVELFNRYGLIGSCAVSNVWLPKN
jgi:hypothetical protein